MMLPVVFGIAGLQLSEEERRFFADVRPAGYILFNRNVRTSDQLLRLTDSLRELAGTEMLPILIDQEGGRVQMLRRGPQGLMDIFADLVGRNDNPEFPEFPPARSFGKLFDHEPEAAIRAARLNARLIGAILADVGITVDCAPVLDLPQPDAHDVIGDRAFSTGIGAVTQLGQAVLEGFWDSGVAGVVKHNPGHGRARGDSHRELPRVEADHATLSGHDFSPFTSVKGSTWAMTAHIVYADIDPDLPATQSPTVIDKIIRGECGFGGILITDAIEMHALSGSMGSRAKASVVAGCDLALCCSGNIASMREVAGTVDTADIGLQTRLLDSLAPSREAMETDQRSELVRERDRLLDQAQA